jgi:DNA-directed RNA polymerase specialized sigma24 family protein
VSFNWFQIRAHLLRTSTTYRFQQSFEEMRTGSSVLAGFSDPPALFDVLHQREGDPARKNDVLKALVEAAQEKGACSDCALTCLLLALWPGLDAIRSRAIRTRADPRDEIAADLLTMVAHSIRNLRLCAVNRIAATILANIQRDMIRACKREYGKRALIADIDPEQTPNSGPDASHTKIFENDLHRVVGRDADLVMRVAVAGCTQAEAAADLGLSHDVARKRYQRALGKLRQHYDA